MTRNARLRRREASDIKSQPREEAPPTHCIRLFIEYCRIPRGATTVRGSMGKNSPGDEGAPARHHDGLLAVDVLLLERVDDVLLLEALERERERALVRALHELDAPEAADAERGDHVEVGQSDLRVLGQRRRRLLVPRAAAHGARAGRSAARLVVVRLRAQLAQVADQLDERAGQTIRAISATRSKFANQTTATKYARCCSHPLFFPKQNGR